MGSARIGYIPCSDRVLAFDDTDTRERSSPE